MIDTITLDEAVERYGDFSVVFSSYYKYKFTFIGFVGEKELQIRVGGDSNDIYRESVTSVPMAASTLLKHWFCESVAISESDKRIQIWDPHT